MIIFVWEYISLGLSNVFSLVGLYGGGNDGK